MPDQSSQRPTWMGTRPRMPHILEDMVHVQFEIRSGHGAFKERRYETHGHRMHGTHGGSNRDAYSQGRRYVPDLSSCCSPDNPHPGHHLDREDLTSHFHHFESKVSSVRPCCSLGNPHPLRDIDRGRLDNHHFKQSNSTESPFPGKASEHIHHRHRASDFDPSRDEARAKNERESRLQAFAFKVHELRREHAYSSNRDEDSDRYNPSQHGEHGRRREPETRRPNHTPLHSERPKATENRKDGASGSNGTGNRRHHGEGPHNFPTGGERHGKDSARNEAKGSNGRRHPDHNEYESKNRNKHTHRDRDDRGNRHHEDRHRENRQQKPSASQPKPKAPFPDHYATLGISPKATPEEITKAARSMRISCHPDKVKKPEMSEDELKAIDEKAAFVGQAADVLQDERLKERYDRDRERARYC